MRSILPADAGKRRVSHGLCALGLAALSAATGCRTTSPARPANEVITLAEGYMVLNEPHVARSYYEEAIRKDPDNGWAILGLARAAFKIGDYQTTLRELRRAEDSRSLSADEESSLTILLGRTYARLGKYQTAWQYLWSEWRRGDVAIRSAIDDDIKALAEKLPVGTPGIREVIAFRPPPRPARVVSVTPRRQTENDPVPRSFSIIPRSAWAPMSSRRSRLQRMGTPFRITVHHSAHYEDGNGCSRTESEKSIRSIQRNHMDVRGWGDIGYHYVIDVNGRIWQGRSMVYQGAHAGDGEANRGNIGIVVLGNFNEHRPTPAQVAALRWLVRHLRRRYGIPAWQVQGHCHYRATACPGTYLKQLLPQIR